MTPSMIVPRGTSEYSSPELIKAENDLSVAVIYDLLGAFCMQCSLEILPFMEKAKQSPRLGRAGLLLAIYFELVMM